MRLLRALALSLLASLPAAAVQAQGILVPADATWRYFKGTTEASTPREAWRDVAFDDSTWLSGPAPFGYGYASPTLGTVLADMQGSYASLMCRHAFDVPDPAAVAGLQLVVNYDDGFVAWLNGTEVARRGMGTLPPSNTRLAQDHEGGVDEIIPLSDARDLLVAGRNVLAIQLHNSALGSSADALLAPRLESLALDPVARGPYLQALRPDAVVVRWRTTLPTETVLEWGPYESPFPPVFPSRVESLVPATEHEIALAGLSPGGHFMYRVADSSGVRSENLSFWTLPRLGSRDLDFAVLGDSGTGESPQHSIGRRMRERRPDFVLHAGDLVYPSGEAENYDQQVFVPFRAAMGGAPLFPAAGNHDLLSAGGAPWLDAFTTFANNGETDERYYSFDAGSVHVTVIDSNRPAADFAAGAPAGDWLRADLAGAASACWRVVVLHHPLYTSDPQFTYPETVALRDALAPLLESGRVDVVFSGHVHAYERSFPVVAGAPAAMAQEPNYVSPPGPIHVVTGGGGADLEPVPGTLQPFTARALSQFHFVWVQVADGLLTLTAVDRAGAAIDQATISRACATDADGDTVPDATDNCAFTPNAGQDNLDADSLGDACDPDQDGDSLEPPADCDDRDPTAMRMPVEVRDLRVRANAAAGPPPTVILLHASLDPDQLGTSRRVQALQGRLAELWADRSFARAACASTGVPPSPAGLELDPGPGSFWFLLRATSACGRGTWGDSSVSPDPRDALDTPGTSPCP